MDTINVGDTVVLSKPVFAYDLPQGTLCTVTRLYEIGADLRTNETGVTAFVYHTEFTKVLSAAEYIQKIQETIPEDTGVKHDSGKAPLTLLDRQWLEATAQVLAFGAKKYAPHNWRKGMKHSRLLDAALRHIHAYIDGEDLDPESGESHLAHASCCLMFATNMQLTRPDLDDRHMKVTT